MAQAMQGYDWRILVAAICTWALVEVLVGLGLLFYLIGVLFSVQLA